MKIVDQLEEIRAEICDHYCKYAEQYESGIKSLQATEEQCDKLLKERCEKCVLNKI